MSKQPGYKARDTSDMGGMGNEMLESMMDSYKETMAAYAGSMPESERDRLYHLGLALYFACIKGIISQDYKSMYQILDAARQYNLEKAGLAGIVQKLEHQEAEYSNSSPEGERTSQIRVLKNDEYGC